MKRAAKLRILMAASGAVAAGLCGLEPAFAASISLNPAKDNTLYESATGALSGGIGDLYAGRTGQPDGDSLRRGLLSFSLASIPSDATINSATLSLKVFKAASSLSEPVSLYPVLASWGEGSSNASNGTGAPASLNDATWLHRFYSSTLWSTPGGSFSASSSATLGVMDVGTYSWSSAQLVADVQGWLNTPASNNGWIILGNETTGFTAKRFYSREAVNSLDRPTLLINYTPVPSWAVSGGGNWGTASNWGGTVPNGVGVKAKLGSAITAPATVTLDVPVTLGTLTLANANAYTVGGAQTLTLDASSGNAAMNVDIGSHTIAAPVTLNDNLDIAVTPALSQLTVSGVLTATGRTINKNGAGAVQFQNVRAAALYVNNGAVRILASGGATGVSKVTSLTIAAAAKLDLSNNKLITATAVGSWTGSTYTGVTGLIKSGRGSSNTWNGSTGIVTSQSAAIGSNITSIGVARASDIRPATATATDLWGGQTITGTDTLVMYTYGGDANLDGKLNIDDYVAIDQGIAASLTGWSNGDFNYDGKINIDDYTTVIDSNIGNQTGTFFTSGDVSDVSAVPEPAGAVLLAGCAVLLRRRSRSAPLRRAGRPEYADLT